MAHHASAKKAIRQTATRTLANAQRKSKVRTFLKKVRTAIDAGQKTEAMEALRTAESEMAKAVKRGIFKQRTLSRTISRISGKIKSIG